MAKAVYAHDGHGNKKYPRVRDTEVMFPDNKSLRTKLGDTDKISSIGDGSVSGAIEQVSNTLTDKVNKTTIIDIAHGGTGATTAANARTNLELGSAATKSSTTSVTSGNTALVTSGAVYNAITDLASSVSAKAPSRLAEDGQVNTWNENVFTVTKRSYCPTSYGVYINFSFTPKVDVASLSEEPFVVISNMPNKTFAPTIGRFVGMGESGSVCTGIFYRHQSYDYAFMIRPFQTLKTGNEYYADLFLPYV